MTQALAGLVVVSFESRLRSETAQLIAKHGARAISAPAMQEIPLAEVAGADTFIEALFSDRIDLLLLLTGVGTTLLIEAAAARRSRAEVVARLAQLPLVCRGPKPAHALRAFGLRPTLMVPEPSTWRDILSTFDRELRVSGRRIYVQEYGVHNAELVGALGERGAQVTCLELYTWALPDDTGPLKGAILRMVRAQAHVAVFTAAPQVDHLFQIARELGLGSAVRRALALELAVASIGPMTSEALARAGIVSDIVPGHPKLGHLVLAIARRAPAILATKSEQRSAEAPLPAPGARRRMSF